MFGVPVKESKHLDWNGPLRSYLARTYGTSVDYGVDASALQSLRQDALGAARNSGGRDLLYRYFVQLDNLSLRIPISEHGCKVSFSWRDLYGKKKEITQHSVAFEKAAVLFNLAAVLWQIGLDSESNKPAFSSFQAAAGIYKLIAENFIHAPSPDFASDTMKTLQCVTMGHAQVMFILNSIEKTPVSLLFRLAKGASTLYSAAADGIEKEFMANSWGEHQWCLDMRFLSNYWAAFAVYQYALHLDAKQHGLAIAYMKEAKSQFAAIHDDINSKFASAKDVVAYLELATSKLKEMEKDNDLLYHERIPPITGEIPETIAATPTPIDKIFGPDELERVVGRELFSNVVPLEVHETASLYSDELDKMRRHEQEKISIADHELSSALEYLDLPRAARNLKMPDEADGSGVPNAVIEWSRQISTSPPLDFDFRTKHQIIAMIETLADSHFEQKQRIKSSIVQASNQDETLKLQYEAISPDIKELCDLSLLSLLFAPPPKQQNLLELDDSSNVDAELEQTLAYCEKLYKIEKERKSVFNELKQRLLDDDIKSALIANRKTTKPQQIFEKEMEKFSPFVKRINATIKHQRTLLAELTAVWKSVLTNPKVKSDATAREQHIRETNQRIDKYRNAYQKWLGLHQGATQAREFYSQLLAQAQSLAGSTGSAGSANAYDLGSLSDSLPSVRAPPPIPARMEANTAYSTPSAFSSNMYTGPGQ